MNNIILIFYNNLTNDSLKKDELLKVLNKNNIVISLINNECFYNIENIINSLKKYNDNTCIQIFFDDYCFNEHFIDYINHLKEFYDINNIFFIDNLDKLKKLIIFLEHNNFELLAQYNESQFKLIKKL